MKSSLSIADLTDRERELLTLRALGELPAQDAAEWQGMVDLRPGLQELAEEVARVTQRLAVAGADAAAMPQAVEDRLEAVRARVVSGRVASNGSDRAVRSPLRRYSLIALPLAAAVTIGFVLLMDAPPPAPDDAGGVKSPPVTFPDAAVIWQAPGAETSLLRPVIIWKGTAGLTYDVRIEDAGGKVLARAEEVQSPWLVETDLPAGASLSVHLRATGKQDVATRDFRVAADAAPLAPNLKEQMEALAAAGRKADALMLLMRLPEGAVPEEEWVVWRKRLTGG